MEVLGIRFDIALGERSLPFQVFALRWRPGSAMTKSFLVTVNGDVQFPKRQRGTIPISTLTECPVDDMEKCVH